jgi:hypothetical protein
VFGVIALPLFALYALTDTRRTLDDNQPGPTYCIERGPEAR